MIPRHEKIDSGSGRRLIEFSIPQAVIREVLSNAFAHQDLSSEEDGIVIEIFKNRVEITNSGKPVLDQLHFLDGAPTIKNKRVFTEMKNLGLVDGQGYGWRKIVKELESRSLPAPEIKIRKNSITVTIWFEKPLKLLSLDQRNSYVPVCQLSKGIYLFKQKFHFLIRLLKAIRRITDQDSFKGTGLK